MPSTTNTKSRAKPAAKKPASATAGPDAIALLKSEHKDVSKLFKDYEKLVKADAEPDERSEVAQQICAMLTTHAMIEEEIFYPALRDAADAEDLLDEAQVEHASVKDLVAQIEAMDPDDALYDAKVTVLGEYVEHHVKEEEGEMFAKARESGVDLKQLGFEMQARKEELIEERPAEEPEVAE